MEFLSLSNSLCFVAIIIFFVIACCTLISCYGNNKVRLKTGTGDAKTDPEKIKLLYLPCCNKSIVTAKMFMLLGVAILLSGVIFLLNIFTFLSGSSFAKENFNMAGKLAVYIGTIVITAGIILILWAGNRYLKKQKKQFKQAKKDKP